MGEGLISGQPDNGIGCILKRILRVVTNWWNFCLCGFLTQRDFGVGDAFWPCALVSFSSEARFNHNFQTHVLYSNQPIMTSRTRPVRHLTRALRARQVLQFRSIASTPRCRTDGVYRELTAMRTRTPFIEALRTQQQGEHGSPTVPTDHSERDVSPKSMSDSLTRIVSPHAPCPHSHQSHDRERRANDSKILPLARDPWLLDSYINASGHIRLGTIFMDLDALAGVIAYKHTGDSVMTVTAAVDRITLKHPLSEICDLELSGMVTFATGRSSMEISIQVAKALKEGEAVTDGDVLLTCAFTMVRSPCMMWYMCVDVDGDRSR